MLRVVYDNVLYGAVVNLTKIVTVIALKVYHCAAAKLALSFDQSANHFADFTF